jgi:flagellar biosynthetic protein FliO
MLRKDGKDPTENLRAWLKRTRLWTGFLTFALFFFTILPICAAGAAGDGPPTIPDGNMGMASLKMGAALLLVIAMIFALYYLSRKIKDGRFSLNRYPAMRIIGSLSLAPKRSIALVEVCGEWLVLGVGTETITLLRRFEDPPTTNNEAVSSGSGTGGGFQSLLRKKIKRSSSVNGSIREKNGTPG